MPSMTPSAPLAEFLPSAPNSAAATNGDGGEGGPRSSIDAAGLPRAADFAALLQSAGLAVPPLVIEERSAATRDSATEAEGSEASPSSAIDGLLFLAVVQPPVEGTAISPALAAVAGGADVSLRGVVGDKRTSDARNAVAVSAATTLEGDALAASEPQEPAVASAAASARVSDTQAFAIAADDAGEKAGSDRAAPRPTLELAAAPANVAPLPTPQRAASDTDAPASGPRGVEASASLSPVQVGTTASPLSVTIETPIHDASWRVDAAARIASLVTRGIEHAELRVSPPELGPVELRIDVRGGEATLAIVATQATARDALEQALPVLRDMLAQQGLSLGQATVADGRAESQAGNGNAPSSRGDAFGGPVAIDDAEIARSTRTGIARGLIDVFA